MLDKLPVIGRLFGGTTHHETDAEKANRHSLIENMTFEVIPLKSLSDAEAALPAGAKVSVTASPAKGLEATQEITCLLYTSPSPRDATLSRMPSSA